MRPRSRARRDRPAEPRGRAFRSPASRPLRGAGAGQRCASARCAGDRGGARCHRRARLRQGSASSHRRLGEDPLRRPGRAALRARRHRRHPRCQRRDGGSRRRQRRAGAAARRAHRTGRHLADRAVPPGDARGRRAAARCRDRSPRELARAGSSTGAARPSTPSAAPGARWRAFTWSRPAIPCT